MSVLMWTYLLVGASFALYIGIAIWSRASHTRDFYVAGGGVQPDRQRHGDRGRLDVRCVVHLDGRPDLVPGLRRQRST